MADTMAGAAGGLELFPVWLILGPRQVGKSTLLRHCAAGGRRVVDLDDLAVRHRANADPVLFARDLVPPLIIDEIQYAPALLSAIKRIADARPGPGAVWITGSQSFEVMPGVQESLAGRVAILRLHGLADEERRVAPYRPGERAESIVQTRLPALADVTDADARDLYLNSYLRTYIERDVRELLGVQKRREFELFVRLCALRTAQLVNLDDLGRDTGISAATARQWVSVLEDSFLVHLVTPWHTNRAKRLVKSAKLYFLDAGLAAWLAGWRTREQVAFGPQAGALLETQVLGNVLAAFHHRAREPRVHFWRDRDGREVDFLVETRRGVVPVEVKLGTPGSLPRLASIRGPDWLEGRVVTPAQQAGQDAALAPDWRAVAPCDLAPHLLD